MPKHKHTLVPPCPQVRMPPTIVLGLKPIPLPGGARPDEEEDDNFKPLWLWTEESGVQGDAGMLRCRRA